MANMHNYSNPNGRSLRELSPEEREALKKDYAEREVTGKSVYDLLELYNMRNAQQIYGLVNPPPSKRTGYQKPGLETRGDSKRFAVGVSGIMVEVNLGKQINVEGVEMTDNRITLIIR